MQDEQDIEQLVLKEAIVSATGLTAEQLQIGIKGDPSLRETAALRERYTSAIDAIYDELEPQLEELLVNRGIYQLFIGFNNAEIRTRSIFDPLREEIHTANKLTNPNYIERHFPAISYSEKIQTMRELYEYLAASKLYDHMPAHWLKITQRRHESWQAIDEPQVRSILSTLNVLRIMPEYYLRNATISIVQSVVRMQFNCDGTQIIRAEDFAQFIEQNLP